MCIPEKSDLVAQAVRKIIFEIKSHDFARRAERSATGRTVRIGFDNVRQLEARNQRRLGVHLAVAIDAHRIQILSGAFEEGIVARAFAKPRRHVGIGGAVEHALDMAAQLLSQCQTIPYLA